MEKRKVKWNGWGYEDEEYPKDKAKKITEILSGFLGLNKDDFSPSITLDKIKVEPPEINIEEIRKKLKSSVITSDKYERVLHSSGKSYKNLIRLRKGKVKKFPEAVIYIKDKREIETILEWCEKNEVACVPYGGGTSVVGGVDVEDIKKPVITCDLTELNRVISADEKSLTATVEAGVRGPNLEQQLRKFGMALRHYPQSFMLSTLGGWIASRSAGHFSSRYGKIEEMIQSIEVITPKGVIRSFDVPATACGPDIPRLFAGSEGTLGIIVSATIKCHRIPTKKFSTSFIFPDFQSACEAARIIIQSEINPPLLRILDEREFMISSLVSGGNFNGGSLLLLGFEADNENEKTIEAEFEKSKEICQKLGGKEEGKRKLDDWKNEYFEQPYLRDVLMDFCIVVDTLETATNWSNLMNLYEKVKTAIENAIFSHTLGGVSCRVTHVYTSGASLYFSFFAKSKKDEEEELWWEIKKSASDAISKGKGTISHHHGVGRDHKKWAEIELKDSLILLKGIKEFLDPRKILNPGAIFD
jgi:alkyldihydroxyacetonephosphate synthase